VQFSLFGTEPKDGVALQKVDWSDSIGRSTVTITKDGQTAKLEFNQAEIAAAPQAPAPPQNVVRPGVPGAAPRPSVPRPVQPIVQPQGYGNSPGGIPNMNANIPRPAGNVTSGAGVIPNSGNGAEADRHRRIRVIQNQ
jgi:hypothetical protein